MKPRLSFFNKHTTIYSLLFPVIMLTNCGKKTNNTGPSIDPPETANTLTLRTNSSKACSNSDLTFCVNEKLQNSQEYLITLDLNKNSINFNQPILSAEEKAKGFTLTPNQETCLTSVSLQATPCSFTLTYSPISSTPVNENNQPIPQTLHLNFTYTNNLNEKINLTQNITYESLSLLGKPAPIPQVVNLKTVIQSNVIDSNVFLLTENLLTKQKTLFFNNEPISNVENYNLNQLDAKQILFQNDAIPPQFFSFDTLHLKKTQLFSNLDIKGVVLGRQATYAFLQTGETICLPSTACGTSFGPTTYPLVYNRNFHFVDTENNADKLYIFSNYEGQIDGAYLTSLNPLTGQEFAHAKNLVIPNTNFKVLYTTAKQNKLNPKQENIFVTLINRQNNQIILHHFSEENGTIQYISTVYSSTINMPFAPVYDNKNNLIYLVTTADELHYKLEAINIINNQRWSLNFNAPISAPFSIRNNNVVVACNDGNIYVLEAKQNSTTFSNILTYPLSAAESINTQAVSFDYKNNLLYIPTLATSNKAPKIYSFHTIW